MFAASSRRKAPNHDPSYAHIAGFTALLAGFALATPIAKAQDVEGSMTCVAYPGAVFGWVQEEPLALDAEDGDLFDENSGPGTFAGTGICSGVDATDPDDPLLFLHEARFRVAAMYTYTTCGVGHWSADFEIWDAETSGWDFTFTARLEMDSANSVGQASLSDVQGDTRGHSIAGGDGTAAFVFRDGFESMDPPLHFFPTPHSHCETGTSIAHEIFVDGGFGFTFHD